MPRPEPVRRRGLPGGQGERGPQGPAGPRSDDGAPGPAKCVAASQRAELTISSTAVPSPFAYAADAHDYGGEPIGGSFLTAIGNGPCVFSGTLLAQ